MKLFCGNYWQNPQMTAAIDYFQKQQPEVFCKKAVLKKFTKLAPRKTPVLESVVNKVAVASSLPS